MLLIRPWLITYFRQAKTCSTRERVLDHFWLSVACSAVLVHEPVPNAFQSSALQQGLAELPDCLDVGFIISQIIQALDDYHQKLYEHIVGKAATETFAFLSDRQQAQSYLVISESQLAIPISCPPGLYQELDYRDFMVV